MTAGASLPTLLAAAAVLRMMAIGTPPTLAGHIRFRVYVRPYRLFIHFQHDGNLSGACAAAWHRHLLLLKQSTGWKNLLFLDATD